ncbi:M24 family metallopeptidase [Actinokineospora pegani]|uniref:M24 family metallopeptidase n=1 Tax=Actinokineospora pegani TaxID=2654637 RepID=UPI0012EA9ACE|nr:Xaa-Pro peptidase family protein [Actinokineospora pegani]
MGGASVYSERIARARDAARAAGTGALVIAPGADLRYLVGGAVGSHERFTGLVLPVDGDPVLVVPKLEAPGYDRLDLPGLGVRTATWVDGEDPHALVARHVGAVEAVALGDMLPAVHVLGLRAALPGVEQRLAGPVLRELRMRKDAHEVEQLRAAGAAIDRVHARMGEWLRVGRTEAEVAADIRVAIVAEGHAEVGFAIVGSGPNGASPHHDVSDRVIAAGDVVVVDIGGALPSGYCSDSTRTYSLGAPADDDVPATYETLRAAQAAAVAAVRPGATAESIDAAARDVLVAAKLGELFIHRTGHGIGIEGHEHPYIVAGNDLRVAEGMAFSIEPGVYLPGRWGARIEDIVVVTDNGVESVNLRPHELVELPA